LSARLLGFVPATSTCSGQSGFFALSNLLFYEIYDINTSTSLLDTFITMDNSSSQAGKALDWNIKYRGFIAALTALAH
jgi:hypothetical protein